MITALDSNLINTILLSIVGFCVVGLVYCTWIWFRNIRVYNFRGFVADLCFQRNAEQFEMFGETRVDFVYFYYDRLPSYYRMTFGFRKLKLESYFGENEIEKMNSYAGQIKHKDI